MATNKLYAILGVVGILLLLVAGAYYFLKNKEGGTPQTSTTETYLGYGMSFSYPRTYSLEERDLSIDGENIHVITIVRSDAQIPEAGEGPTAINVLVVDNEKKQSVSSWVASSDASNGGLRVGDLPQKTIGGKETVSYQSTGLYESDNYALESNGFIYLFSASWMSRDDQILKDFDVITKSVSFE